ncbi:hypothetical protein RUND412_001355 [Rhizina undulata]
MNRFRNQEPREDPNRVFARNELNWLPPVVAPSPHSHSQRPVPRVRYQFWGTPSLASATIVSEATPTVADRTTTTHRASISSRARTASSQTRIRKREPPKPSDPRVYACPYSKYYGDRNHKCAGTKGNLKVFLAHPDELGKVNPNLREHVRTVHLRHLKCSHGGCSFRTGRVNALNGHQDPATRRCPSRRGFDPVDSDTEAKGIRVDELKGCKGKRKGDNVGYTWDDLYMALFPGQDVPSPWYQDVASLGTSSPPSIRYELAAHQAFELPTWAHDFNIPDDIPQEILDEDFGVEPSLLHPRDRYDPVNLVSFENFRISN